MTVRDIGRIIGKDFPFREGEKGLRLRTGIVDDDHAALTAKVKVQGEDTTQDGYTCANQAMGVYKGQKVYFLEDDTNRLIIGSAAAESGNYRDAPYCWVRRTSNLSIPNVTVTYVTWNSALRNSGPSGGEVWRGAGSSYFYPIVPGIWQFDWSVRFISSTGASTYDTWLQLVGTNFGADDRIGGSTIVKPSTSIAVPMMLSGSVSHRFANQTVEQARIAVYQDSGGTRTLEPYSFLVSCEAKWIGVST